MVAVTLVSDFISMRINGRPTKAHCRVAINGDRQLPQRFLQETVTLFLRDKTQAMSDALRSIFGVM